MDNKSYNGSDLLSAAMKKYKVNLSLLVAETALWAHPDVHKKLLEYDKSGAFYPYVRRAKTKSEKKGQIIGKIRLDDNTYANRAIKKALGIPQKELEGFACCHIWQDSCYDAKYHTVVANLVLLPAALQSLADYNEEIMAVLQYRSFELYNWYPHSREKPRKPDNYPHNWRQPFALTAKIEKAIQNRRL